MLGGLRPLYFHSDNYSKNVTPQLLQDISCVLLLIIFQKIHILIYTWFILIVNYSIIEIIRFKQMGTSKNIVISLNFIMQH
jgi:hypothetical protein